MFNPKELDVLAKKLCAAIPSSLGEIETSIHDHFKAILQATFAELDLVTREEFDAQVKVLARTREKVELLQKQLASHTK